MPLVINSLGGGHTHTHTHTHTSTHTDVRTGTISRNQAHAGRRPARAWFKNLLQRDADRNQHSKEFDLNL